MSLNFRVRRNQKKRGVTEIKITEGGEYTLEGKDFVGIYHLMKNGKAMPGKRHKKTPKRRTRRTRNQPTVYLVPVSTEIERTEDIVVTSTSSREQPDQPTEKNTRTEVVEGQVSTFKVGNFSLDGGSITIFGVYPQNQIDIPTYDLSTINIIDDADVTFDFVLCLKDGEDSEPKLFTTKLFYDSLVQNYNNRQPFRVNDTIDQRNIVVVDIAPLKEKVERLRIIELNTDIDLTNVSEADRSYIEVIRNLFVNSNYEKNEVDGLTANPTYTLIELIRYISWVVSKPAQNYDDRLIPAELLGEFTRGTDEPPKEDEPSPKEDEETDDDGNTTDPPVNTAYLPIGRRGLYDEEEAFYSGRTWTWFEFSETWMLTNSDGDPKGGGII
tara:strand:- start:553 stop:1701 length:1149 start_codon:yes stop_codon:yes gene_type:complete